MRKGRRVTVIIPAWNEEHSIGRVIEEIPGWVDDVIVADNGSTDATAREALATGRARVVSEPRRGYGSACLAGIAAAGAAEILVFLDADLSDYPARMQRLVDPLAEERAELVISSRALGLAAPGSLSLQQRLGNRLACLLMRLFWQARYTDLGPFRAITRPALGRLRMTDRGYGWTVQMQLAALGAGLRVLEVPVDYRRRVGSSKVSGTLRGVIGAGSKILYLIFREVFRRLLLKITCRQPPSRLILFSRYPTPGQAKTRLIPALGPAGACRLQRLLTERAVRQARRLVNFPSTEVEICFSGGGRPQMRAWLGPGLRYAEQSPGDLGQRMWESISRALADGAGRVVVAGTDVPGLDEALLRRAFSALERADVVVGPATDGGYYLIGTRRAVPELFQGLRWGSSTVYRETMERASRCGLITATLDTLADLDWPQDLTLLDSAPELKAPGASGGLISVIIPALDEEKNIGKTLERVLAEPGGPLEAIVADGGSRDRTVEIALELGAAVVRSAAGRAVQMNAGAETARGDYLLFLHADTLLSPGFARLVRETLEEPAVAAGAFTLGIDSSWRSLRLIERTTWFRSRVLGLPYGDQALFLRAETFRLAGAYPEIPVLEDFVLVRRLKSYGRVVTLPQVALTDARRWVRQGFWHTTWQNQLAILLHSAGFPPEKIAERVGRG